MKRLKTPAISVPANSTAKTIGALAGDEDYNSEWRAARISCSPFLKQMPRTIEPTNDSFLHPTRRFATADATLRIFNIFSTKTCAYNIIGVFLHE